MLLPRAGSGRSSRSVVGGAPARTSIDVRDDGGGGAVGAVSMGGLSRSCGARGSTGARTRAGVRRETGCSRGRREGIGGDGSRAGAGTLTTSMGTGTGTGASATKSAGAEARPRRCVPTDAIVDQTIARTLTGAPPRPSGR